MPKIGEAAVAWVKQVIKHGAGNIKTAIRTSHGKSYKAFARSVEYRSDRDYRGGARKYTRGSAEAIAYRAATATLARGGNCEEHADLTFYYLMTKTNGLNINYACGSDHAYIIVGNPTDKSTWFVIDPWTTGGIVGPYADYVAQPKKSWEIQNQTTGTNVDALEKAYRAGLDNLAKKDEEAADYSSDPEDAYEDRAQGAYDL